MASIFAFFERPAEVEWCEAKYYGFETANSISNALYIVVGLVALSWCFSFRLLPRFWFSSGFILLVGVGSALFHALQTVWSACWDAMGMFLGLTGFWYSVFQLRKTRTNWWLIGAWVIVNVGLSALWYWAIVSHGPAFDIAFAILAVSTSVWQLWGIRRSPDLRKMLLVAQGASILGFAAWILDTHLCSYLHMLRLHAVWHITTAYTLYVGFIIIVELHTRGTPRSFVLSRFLVPHFKYSRAGAKAKVAFHNVSTGATFTTSPETMPIIVEVATANPLLEETPLVVVDLEAKPSTPAPSSAGGLPDSL